MPASKPPQFITDAAQGEGSAEEVRLLLAHGAGAGSSSPFLATIARLIAARGVGVHRFDFAYMAARNAGSRRPPPRADALVDEYRAAVDAAPPGGPLLIGGKSMGGRVASMIADTLFAEERIAGLVCLGYPFHPPKAPDKLRTAHPVAMASPALIVQGAILSADAARSRVMGYRGGSPCIGLATAIMIWGRAEAPGSHVRATWRQPPTPSASLPRSCHRYS